MFRIGFRQPALVKMRRPVGREISKVIDVGLRVVGMLESAFGAGHDARLGVGEFDLTFACGPGSGAQGLLAAGLPGALGPGCALGQIRGVTPIYQSDWYT
jgi:hypothetical protein